MSSNLPKLIAIISAVVLALYSTFGFYSLISPATTIGKTFITAIGIICLGLPNLVALLSWYGVIGSENLEDDDEGLKFKASVNKYSLYVKN